MVALAIILASLYLANRPYIEAYRHRPPGTRFWAVPTVNYYDANQYLAFTRLTLHGHWLIGDPFTSEPVKPRLIMPHVYFQALISKLFGLDVLGSFQVCRVFWGLLLLLSGWWFGWRLIRSSRQRWVFLALLCFSAGGTGLLDRLGIHVMALDANQPEALTFFTLGNLPHLSLSTALVVSLFCTLLEYERKAERRWLILTAVLSLLLSWVHPFDFLILAAALTTYLAVRWLADRQLPGPVIRHAAALLVGALPAGSYLFLAVSTDPIYQRLANDTLQKATFLPYAITFGPFMVGGLGVLGRRELLRRYALPLCWVVSVLLFLTTPFRLGGKQPRMVEGIHVPLCLLAAVGSAWLPRMLRWRPLERRASFRPRIRAIGSLVASLAMLAVGLLGGEWVYRNQNGLFDWRPPYHFQPPQVVAAFGELERSAAEGEVALGGTFTGGWCPVLSSARTYWGHWHMTLNQPRKLQERDWFFCAPGQEGQKAEWLRQQGIRWVVLWPWEWSDRTRWPNGAATLDGVPGLKPVYRMPEITLFRFEPEAQLTGRRLPVRAS